MKPAATADAKPSIVMVAYHFPPQTGSSGQLRTLKFAHYLPALGWRPVVITAHPRAYESTDPGTKKSLPEDLSVTHAFALDTKRHLSFRGAYPDLLALPDRWAAWVFGAVPSALRAIRKHRAEVLFTTFPICSAVFIGLIVHRLTKIPWIVDLRDSMTEEGYPRDPRMRRVWRWIERHAVHCASRILFTTPSTRRMYLERYPDLPPERCLVISNGYDERDFLNLSLRENRPVTEQRPLRLLHSGTLYPEERDPRPFFQAISRLKSEGRVNKDNLQIAFRAPGSENLFRDIIRDQNIADIVQLQPHVPYHQSLQECADADALLLFQAANCDHQIPAKAYEYLRVARPLLALTTPSGDTAALLNQTGGATIIDLASASDIHRALPPFLDAIRAATHPVADRSKLARYARQNQARDLAQCLSQVRQESSKAPARAAEHPAAGTASSNG
jgi:glycosyltransferase involved in cell wall biosynthesis